MVFGEERETSVESVVYKCTNDEELLVALKELWDMIDKYNLLSMEPNSAPGSIREVIRVIIGIEDLLPARSRRKSRNEKTRKVLSN